MNNMNTIVTIMIIMPPLYPQYIGSQLPLLNPRTDARTNLLDAITCATAYFTPPHVQLQEVCVCFGGLLLRGNRAQKVDSMMYRAFASPTMPPLATLGVEVQWNRNDLLQPEGSYRPRFKLYVFILLACTACASSSHGHHPQGFQRHPHPHCSRLRSQAGLWGFGGTGRQRRCARILWCGQHARPAATGMAHISQAAAQKGVVRLPG